MRDLYTENYKTLLKKIEDPNKWEGILRSWNGRFTTVRQCQYSLYWFKESYNPYQNSNCLFWRNGQADPKILWECKGPWITTTIFKKNWTKLEGSHIDFKTYYKATVIKTVGTWHKDRHTDQCQRIKSPEINPHTIVKWLLTRVPKPFNGGKNSLLKMVLENWMSTC